MNVVFITHYSALFGANRSLLAVVDGLSAHGVRSFVIAPQEGELTQALRTRAVPVVVLPVQVWIANLKPRRRFVARVLHYCRWRLQAPVRLLRNICLLPKLRRQLQAWGADLVYTNTSVTPIGAMLAKFSRLPHVWHLREFGDLDYGVRFDWGKALTRKVLLTADARIAVSRAVRRHFFGEQSGTSSHVVYNGVISIPDAERLLARSRSQPARRAARTFCIVGLLHPSKGQDIAIMALATLVEAYPEIRLLIAGSGGYEQQLRALAAELRVEQSVEFLGYLPNPYDAYLRSDVVLMCSRHEAMGRTTAEAMSACKPVIGYDAAGTAEIIDDGVNGILYRGGHIALAEAMRHVIERAGWAEHLGFMGWKKARAEFTIEAYAARVFEVISAHRVRGGRAAVS